MRQILERVKVRIALKLVVSIKRANHSGGFRDQQNDAIWALAQMRALLRPAKA